MSGIYLHIPFCKQACHYCDFHFSTSLKNKHALVKALITELTLRRDELANEVVKTVYFGGGTPSLLDSAEINEILNSVSRNYRLHPKAEITLEANPDDLTADKLKQFKNSGINRLSIGIQSFYEEDLRLMNRAHSEQEALNCLDEASVFFTNISIDLIYGIPGMGEDRLNYNIEKALSFKIPHISAYALTVEPKTALHSFISKGLIDPVDDEQANKHFMIMLDKLEQHDFIHYELSNFGKKGFFSKNNTAYWQQKKYIGIGPSAHSYNGRERSWNVANNAIYIKKINTGECPSEKEVLSLTDRYNEYVMTGLRTKWGVSLKKVAESFGEKHCEYLVKQAEKYILDNYLYLDGDTLLIAKKGKFLSDGIASDLFLLNLE